MKTQLMNTTNMRHNPAMSVGFYDPLANPNICSVDIAPQPDGGSQPNAADTGTPPAGNNSPDSGQQQNNNGHEGNFDTLFNPEPEPEPQAAPAAAQQAPSTPPATATELMDGLVNGMQFAEGMTEEGFKAFSEGDISGFNKMIQQQNQSIVRQILPVMARLLQSSHADITKNYQGEITSKFDSLMNSNKVENEIADTFGFKDNPTMQAVAESVYKGALQQVKGDHSKAIEVTKAMLTQMGTHLNTSLNITTPPEGQSNQGGSTDFKSLFSDL